jgi:hypothetical protein
MARKAVTVVASCSDCGTVRLPSSKCSLLHCRDTDEDTIAYPCPDCGRRTAVPCSRTGVIEFFALGVRINAWNMPEELQDPIRTTGGREARDAMLDMVTDDSWLSELDRL